MVFGKSLLFCPDIHRLSIAIRLCADICADHVLYDGSTARIVPFGFCFDHHIWIDADITGHWNDYWCCVRSYGELILHFISFFILTVLFGTLLGWCHSRTICNCSQFYILWIFRTFIGCIAVSALVILHFISEICGRGLHRCHVRLRSTKIEMQWNLLSLSDTR